MQLTQKKKTALIAFLIFNAVVVAFFICLLQLKSDRQNESALRDIGVTIYPQGRALSDFQLVDQRGKPFTKNDFNGHWNLVFFGFTNCPDICPFTMAQLKRFYEGLDAGVNEKPKVFLVTVDPARDNPDSMKTYLAKYNDDFIGLSGDAEIISQLAKQLYVVYGDTTEREGGSFHGYNQAAKEPNDEASQIRDDYLVSHSRHIAVINPQGEYHAVLRAPHRNRDIETAYLELIR